MRGPARWALAAALLTVAGGALAQEDELAPPVEIEDVAYEELVVPLEESQETTVDVRVGCEAHEVPNTDTRVTLEPTGAPDWLDVIVSPRSFGWTTTPEDCPSTGTPFERTTELHVAADQKAAAYEPVAFRLEADVVKQPPAEAEERTYGPFTGNVTLTPGYFHLHNVRVDEKIKQTDPGQTLVFEGTIQSFANHETAYTLETVEALDGFSVSYEPQRLVLASDESRAFAVEVGPEDGSQAPSGTVSVQTQIHGESTHELGGETGTSQVSFLAKFQTERPDPRDQVPVPETSTLASLAALASAALGVAASRRGRG